jgi:DNA-binding SARP family transcriptional activator
MLPVRVRVLGGLAVEGVDQSALGSRKQRRLLARLVLAQPRRP